MSVYFLPHVYYYYYNYSFFKLKSKWNGEKMKLYCVKCKIVKSNSEKIKNKYKVYKQSFNNNLPVLLIAFPPLIGQPTDVLAFDAKLKYAKNCDLVVFSCILK